MLNAIIHLHLITQYSQASEEGIALAITTGKYNPTNLYTFQTFSIEIELYQKVIINITNNYYQFTQLI
ncbi:hypothetical protein CS533_16235 [Yersinia bercovieri]|uniref:Uncharacterized protein n=1 Tax=Yersinia bercovieri TaxID=634 RepID=A0A2G4TZE3_YERBE|nr:hypothetical protein CS533_16235 [Yersinia bercovieri]